MLKITIKDRFENIINTIKKHKYIFTRVEIVKGYNYHSLIVINSKYSIKREHILNVFSKTGKIII